MDHSVPDERWTKGVRERMLFQSDAKKAIRLLLETYINYFHNATAWTPCRCWRVPHRNSKEFKPHSSLPLYFLSINPFIVVMVFIPSAWGYGIKSPNHSTNCNSAWESQTTVGTLWPHQTHQKRLLGGTSCFNVHRVFGFQNKQVWHLFVF